MRILLLATRVPFSLHNGEDLRIFNLAKYLSANNEIDLLTYRPNADPPIEVAGLFRRLHFAERQPVQGPERSFLKRIYQSLLPEHIYPYNEELDSQLGEIVHNSRYDFVWIPAWPMIPYISSINGIPVLLDVMDDGVLENLRELRYSRTPKEALHRAKNVFTTFRFERTYFAQAAVCSLVSEQDARTLKRLCPRAKVVVVHNGVDVDYFKPLQLAEKFPSLVFEGNMSFGPNVDAAVYLCSEILPLVQKEIPGTKLFLVGKDPVSEVRAFAGEDVLVTGFVDDVRPFLDQASVFVCPMRRGAGIKNKLLQAWAMAKPVVATPMALGGLKAIHGKNILVAKHPKNIAREICRFLRDKDLRIRLGTGARTTAVENYSWRAKSAEFESAMKECVLPTIAQIEGVAW